MVVGTWITKTLTFDVQGTLPEKDLLARLDTAAYPRIILYPNEDAQYIQYDTLGGIDEFAEGSFDPREEGIRLNLSGANVDELLLPTTLDLTLETDSTLVFSAARAVNRAKLKQLVPEFEDEPFADPVPGFLRLVFVKRD